MRVADFDFHLPDDLIAQEARPRGQSRLMILDRATGGIEHASIADLPRCVRDGDLLVVNNTRVSSPVARSTRAERRRRRVPVART
jgi:S-adenosylmethionine:tRNA ribosyltransferase-isomerase